jgi:photosystem II stability/assembly factor-like uncharacterized protein
MEGTILRTQDGGTQWTAVESDIQDDLRAIQFFDKQRGIIVGANGTILRTTNGGTRWNKVDTEFPLSLFNITIN